MQKGKFKLRWGEYLWSKTEEGILELVEYRQYNNNTKVDISKFPSPLYSDLTNKQAKKVFKDKMIGDVPFYVIVKEDVRRVVDFKFSELTSGPYNYSTFKWLTENKDGKKRWIQFESCKISDTTKLGKYEPDYKKNLSSVPANEIKDFFGLLVAVDSFVYFRGPGSYRPIFGQVIGFRNIDGKSYLSKETRVYIKVLSPKKKNRKKQEIKIVPENDFKRFGLAFHDDECVERVLRL